MKEETVEIVTHSPEETERLGEMLAELLPTGSVVALHGELAAGKTCLVRGMARKYARGEIVSSPTFTIVNQYGENPALYHVDLYRLEAVSEIRDLGYEELFEPDGITVVEWAERAESLLPEKRLDIFLEVAGENERRLTMVNRGTLAQLPKI
jgi:tRNA threonylcarbamoyladenosine biosynthesis protein TsaE